MTIYLWVNLVAVVVILGAFWVQLFDNDYPYTRTVVTHRSDALLRAVLYVLYGAWTGYLLLP